MIPVLCSAGDRRLPHRVLVRPAGMTPRIAGRLALLAFLAIYGFVSLRTPEAYRLLDSVDLAIHETGHLVFAPFGEWLAMFGGTLFQVLVPLAFVAHFLRRGEWFGAAVCLWWVAQNFWNISVYIADARAQQLPLVGGGEHDWFYLLASAGKLARDRQIAQTVHGIGVLIYMIALGFGVIALRRIPEQPSAPQPEPV